ncbi:hypothetical protein [Sphaerotilus hippei]|nr:hypothetical protein [Sphaerotilus hippei]
MKHVRPVPALPSLIALGALLACSVSAQAETSPYYIGASQSFTSDSNVRRAATGNESSDVISATGLRAGLDQPLGRQRLFANLSVDSNRYNKTSELNHTSYAVGAGLDWETVERLSGKLSLDSRQSLYRDTSQVLVRRSLVRSDTAGFEARLGTVTLWSFDAGLSAGRVRYSDDIYRASNLSQHTFSAGARYQPSPDWNVRLGVRRTDGKYPDATVQDDFSRNDFDVTTRLQLSGASVVDARLSRTSEKHSIATKTDVNGFTGSLGWTWQASGKSSLGVVLSRDSSVGSYDTTAVASASDANTTLTNSLAVRGTWQATAKIRLNATLGYAQRTLDGNLIATGARITDAKDSFRRAGLSLDYALLRNVDLGCALNWEERSVQEQITQTYAYNAKTFGCFGQIYLR